MAKEGTFMSKGGGAVRVLTVDQAVKSLQADIVKIPFKTLSGMIKGGLIIQGAAQKLVPVDLANLKASAFTVWGKKTTATSGKFSGEDGAKMETNHKSVVSQEKAGLSKNLFTPEVEVGFSAYYAIFVHEDLDAKHKVGQAKYLDSAIASSVGEVIAAVKMEASL